MSSRSSLAPAQAARGASRLVPLMIATLAVVLLATLFSYSSVGVASAQSDTISGDQVVPGVNVYTAGQDEGPVGDCTGTPGGQPTDDIVLSAITDGLLLTIGDEAAEIVDFTLGADIESDNASTLDDTLDAVITGLTAIDDFGLVADGNDDTANYDAENGGSLTVALTDGQVIQADGVVASGTLGGTGSSASDLDGHEIFIFEDAEFSGTTIELLGISGVPFVIETPDLFVNPNSVSAADDILIAIDIDSLVGFEGGIVFQITITDDGIPFDPPSRASDCAAEVITDTSLEVDAIAVRQDTVIPASIDIEKSTNGEDADDAPGPSINVGDPIEWTYVVTNLSSALLTNVVVSDDLVSDLSCPLTELEPFAQMTCTATGVAVAGPYENIGTVSATPPSGEPIGDEDPSHYTGIEVLSEATLAIQKFVNGDDAEEAPGESIEVGDPVTFTFVVTNSGDQAGTILRITDSILGEIDVATACPTLEVPGNGEVTCTVESPATLGTVTNTAVVEYPGPDGEPVTSPPDDGNYTGVQAVLEIEKSTNGEDADDYSSAPVIEEGSPVVWTYVVTNTGTGVADNIVVSDDSLTEEELATLECESSGPIGPGETITCTAEGVARNAAYVNVATVSGTNPAGDPLDEATDPSNYVGFAPVLEIEKTVNGEDADAAPGVSLQVGTTATFEYVVTNTGNGPARNVVVVDDQIADLECEVAELAPGESLTCTATATVTEGPYVNTASVSREGPDGERIPGPEDPANYLGLKSSIGDRVWLDTNENGTQDAGESGIPGVAVKLWSADDSGVPDAVVAETVTDADGNYLFDNVSPDANFVVQFLLPDGSTFTLTNVGDDSTDSDPDPATGITGVVSVALGDDDLTVDAGVRPRYASVEINKLTNGADGTQIMEGAAVSWTYAATNTGSFNLVNVRITDNREGEICVISSLPIGTTSICTETGVAVVGGYTNVGTVVGDPVGNDGQPARQLDGSPVPSPGDDDPSSYTGIAPPVEKVIKFTG